MVMVSSGADMTRSKFTAIQFPNSRFNRCLESGLRPELVKSGQSERIALASQMNLGKEPMEAKKESAKPKELDMWESVMACHRLVLSQTAGISLMVVPSRVTAALANRIREEEEREGVVQEVMQIFAYLFTFISISNFPGAADGQDRARLSHGEGVRWLLQRDLEPREDGAGQAIAVLT